MTDHVPVLADAFCELLEAAGVATVYEAAGRVGVLDVDFEQILPGRVAAGQARTVLCSQDDNRAVHEALSRTQPNEILVVTMPKPAPIALVGELIGIQAKQRGARALVIDAAVRDVEQLRALGLPVWARWRRVNGATKEGRGRVDGPIVIGGTRIETGDYVVCDADGVAVVAARRADEVAAAVRGRLDREAALSGRFANGELSYDIYGLRSQDSPTG